MFDGTGTRDSGRRRTDARRTHSRHLLLLALISLIALSVSGAASLTVAQAQPTRQLVIDTQFDQLTADPARDASNSSRYIRGLVYDTLTAVKPRLVNGRYQVSLSSRPVPWLAQSYRSDRSGRVWTFNLRRNAVFSDGRPVTSADVVWSIRRVKNIKSAPAVVTETFAKIEAVGRYTVRITTSIPNPAVPFLVSNKGVGIINSTVARQNGATDGPNAAKTDKAQAFFDKNSLGSGPYILRTFSTTGTTVLARNPRFWGAKPFYDQLVFRNVKPEIARLNIRSGRSDIAMGMTPDQASTLPGSVRVYRAPSTTVFYMQANFKKSVSTLAANRNLWDAVRYGLNYQKLVRLAGAGAIQACGLLPRQFLGGLPPSACVKRDLARARAALARTGVQNPTLEIEFPTDYVLEGMSFATISAAIQADLKEIGLNVKLRGAPLTAWLPRWIDAKPHMVQGAQAAPYPDPNSASAYLPTGYRGQYAGYKATDARDLTALGVRAQRELNPQRRAALFRQLQQKFNRESPLIPQFQPSTIIAANSRIKGVVVVPAFFIDPTILSE